MREKLFLLREHRLSLHGSDPALSRGQKDTFLSSLQGSRVRGGRMGAQWHRGNYAASIACEFLPFDVCFGSDYKGFFPCSSFAMLLVHGDLRA